MKPRPDCRSILHLIPTLGGGGAERQLAMLVREQVRRGFEVHVGLRRGGVYAGNDYLHGAAVHQLGDFRSASPRLVASMHKLICKLRPDLVQTWLPQADVCGGLAARLARVPWVLSERNSAPAYAGSHPTNLARRLVARFSSAIVANSRVGASYWSGHRRGTDVAVVSNAVDLVAIRSAAATGEAMRDDASKPLVLAVGRLVEEKAHQVAIAAWAQAGIHEGELRIYGDGLLRPNLTAAAERCAQRASVKILPFNPNWWTLFGHSRLLLNLSRYEGAPNVVMEAMAAGVPLIVSDIPSHRELLDESCAWFVPVDDASATAAAIQACLGNPELATSRARVAVQRAESKTVAAAADAYQAIYNRVLRAAPQ